jgi:putative membrane protein
LDDVAFIKQGWFGQEWILLQWYKIQSVEMKQTIFQRRRGLASLRLYTAAGSISVPFIDKDAANQVVNYALYKIESSKESWM